MARLERAGRRHHQAAEQAVLHGGAVDAQVGGLAHADVVPGRAFDAAELPRPDMRLFVLVEHEAALLDLRQRVGRRILDPLDLAESSAAVRAFASGIGSSTSLLDLGTRFLSQ
jgi:hypothetical protein